MVIEASRFINGKLYHFFGAWSQTNFAQHDAVSTTDDAFDCLPNFLKINTKTRKHFRGDAFPLTNEAKQEMFCSNVVVLEALRFFLGQAQHLSGSFGKSIKPISIVHTCFIPRATETSSRASTAQQPADSADYFIY
jgi:hypothetical protein